MINKIIKFIKNIAEIKVLFKIKMKKKLIQNKKIKVNYKKEIIIIIIFNKINNKIFKMISLK